LIEIREIPALSDVLPGGEPASRRYGEETAG
jgi:hypothetical protein